MPSQEDYLDELLKSMSDEDEAVGDEVKAGPAPDLDSLAEMSEEEIAKRLSEGAAGRMQQSGENIEDILDIPRESGNGDLGEIQDLLRKADRNEAVDGENTLFGNNPTEKSPADKLLADIERAGETSVAGEGAKTKQERALEKKRLKEEKKAAREAARAGKKEKRREKKGRKNIQQAGAGQEMSNAGSKVVREYDMAADRELLDSIVTEAGKVERRASAGERNEPSAPVDLMELAAALEAERDVDPSQEVPYEEEYAAAGTGDADSGILALDLDEVDNYIPDITKSSSKGGKEKKKGIMSKFFAFLTEEEEEPENENLPISDENQEIIREMDKEDAEKAKKKVQKKAKKKEKAAQKKAAQKKEKKPKKAKPPKPKKEKKPREEEPYLGKKLTFKKVLPILLLGASVGAAIFIFVYLSADYTNKQIAEEAFQAGDYQTCYVNLYGKKRNEKEEMMYGKSESILYIRIWYQEYLKLEEEGDRAKALDCLIRIVNDYPALYEYAFRWEAETEVDQVYTAMLDALSGEYGITETQAKEIAALKSDIEYTRAVRALAGESGYGAEFGDPVGAGSRSAGEEDDGENLPQDQARPDELPEEAELENEDFGLD